MWICRLQCGYRALKAREAGALTDLNSRPHLGELRPMQELQQQLLPLCCLLVCLPLSPAVESGCSCSGGCRREGHDQDWAVNRQMAGWEDCIDIRDLAKLKPLRQSETWQVTVHHSTVKCPTLSGVQVKELHPSLSPIGPVSSQAWFSWCYFNTARAPTDVSKVAAFYF